MEHLPKKTCQNGISYTLVGDYYIPDLQLPEENRPIGIWGRMYKAYLEQYHPAQYNDLGWMVLLQIVFVHPPPNPNRPGLFRQFQVGDVVVANQRIIQAIVFIVNMFFEFFHVVDLLILV